MATIGTPARIRRNVPEPLEAPKFTPIKPSEVPEKVKVPVKRVVAPAQR